MQVLPAHVRAPLIVGVFDGPTGNEDAFETDVLPLWVDHLLQDTHDPGVVNEKFSRSSNRCPVMLDKAFGFFQVGLCVFAHRLNFFVGEDVGDDYKALEETAYLLRSPKNAKRLLESILELESSKGTERELLD